MSVPKQDQDALLAILDVTEPTDYQRKMACGLAHDLWVEGYVAGVADGVTL